MRKKLVILLSFLVATLIPLSTISPSHASITSTSAVWQPPYIERGYDSLFYSTNVAGYENGTTATLEVIVYNNYHSPNVNVTDVKLVFSAIGINESASLPSPVEINYGRYQSFNVGFTALLAEFPNAPPQAPYSSTVYVNYNVTGAITQAPTVSPLAFVVLSPDQIDMINLYNEYQADLTWSSFSSSVAQSLMYQAKVQYSLATTYYIPLWDLTNAMTHLQNATNLYGQAIGAEENYTTASQGATLNESKAIPSALNTIADAAKTFANGNMNSSYGWILFGFGFILIGIGVIVYAFRKPKKA
jgi:hypothetical protein